MDDTVGATLRGLLTPVLRDELLDDPRRLAELVRERLGTDRRREAAFLNTVMQEGVPKRLLAMPAGSLTRATITNYARKVSEDTGLKEDVARASLETWASGLGLKINGSDDQSKTYRESASDQRVQASLPKVTDNTFGKLLAIWQRDNTASRTIGALLMLQGGVQLLLNVSWDFFGEDGYLRNFLGGIGILNQLAILVAFFGIISMISGAAILLRPRRDRWPYAAAATASLLCAIAYLLRVLQGFPLDSPSLAEWFVALTGPVFAPVCFVCFNAYPVNALKR